MAVGYSQSDFFVGRGNGFSVSFLWALGAFKAEGGEEGIQIGVLFLEPRVLENLFSGGAVLWVPREHLHDQALHGGGKLADLVSVVFNLTSPELFVVAFEDAGILMLKA